MALQMATNITPDSLSGVGSAVFNALDGLQVTWQVNGVSPLLAYQIVLQQNDGNSTQVYTTGKVTLASPFYGVNYKGETVYFDATPISAATLSTAGVTNGNAYKMIITQWWGATDADSVTQNSPALIEAWTPPVLALTSFPSTLTGRTYSFTASFSQAEGDTLSWVRWRIATAGNESDPLLDTGNIYGTSQLQVDYDSFFTGTRYSVCCDVETIAGQDVSTGWQSFDVSYSTISPNGLLDVECRCDGSIGVNWSTARSTIGESTGDYSITPDGEIVLEPGAYVDWSTENEEPIAYVAPWTLMWRGVPAMRNGGDLFRLETSIGVVTASIAAPSTGTATVTAYVDGTAIGTISVTTPTVYLNRTWTIALNADKLFAAYTEPSGGLYPDTTLYPETTLYPQTNTSGTVTQWSTSVTYTQGTIETVELLGAQTCDWLWIVAESMSDANVQSVLADYAYEPDWTTYDTVFLAAFSDDLNAGNLNTTGYTLYRRNLTSGAYERVGEFGISQLAVIDYAVRNNNGYVYQLWYTDATTYTSTPIESVSITPFCWDYVLLACSQDGDGVYHVEKKYAFASNVSTSAISNNNEPNTEKNFTRYPVWQQDTALYKSGKLKAYIGSVNMSTNRYEGDTAAYLDELMSLSQSSYTLFLKDRRGDITMVRTSAAITATISDELPTQNTMIEIPWVEVGSAEGLSIILGVEESLSGEDEIYTTSVEIDIETGALIWTYPNGYDPEQSGSGLALNNAGNLLQVSSPWYNPASMHIDQQTQNLFAEQ